LLSDTKILLTVVFAFILITGSIPFASITKAYSSSYDDYQNEYDSSGGGYNDNNYPDYSQKYQLPPGFNQPTQDTPWPDEIIPADFPLRDACLDGKKIPKEFLTTFKVHAIELDIVYNAFGFHDPDGRMYVLEEDKDKVLQKVAQNPNSTVTEVQPLAIRTNIGQCVEIKFTNDLREEYASIHPTGVGLDPNKDDGTFVGFNEDTTVPPGQSITYRWFPDVEGAHFFSDAARQVVESDLSLLGDWATEDLQSLRQHGLFGALMVEPQGATWTDPFTGEPLKSGVKADVHYPDKIRQDTREFVIFYHDEAGIVDPFGDPTRAPNGEIQPVYTLNYRGDTIDSRSNPKFLPFNCNPGVDPAVCRDTDFFYNSWVHGDPGGGDMVFPAYSGDPVRFILIGAQTEESHVHHLHEHRWKADSSFGGSPTLDVQTVSAGNEHLTPTNLAFGDFTVNPDTTYAQALIADGAGYQTGADDDEHFTGDVIFHCHLFPHYGSGMWGLMRVLDRINSPFAEIVENSATDGSGGNALRPVGPVLMPLPDSNDDTQEADDFQPGFPYFIESNDDGSPKLPPNPNGDTNGRDYTDLEWRSTNYFQRAVQNGEDPEDALEDRSAAKPGAPYDDPCPPDAKERHYNVVAINDDVIYNKFGHHDPFGRIYVLAEEAEAILNGEKEPEPLVLRAKMGECITTTFQNNLTIPGPVGGPDVEEDQLNTRLSMHIHFVGYDVLGSDGVVVGYDYMQGAKAPIVSNNPDEENPGEKIDYRWYADEQGTIFWHDHINGIEQGFHGSGAMLVVEPPDSVFLDPETGDELEFPTATEIMVAPEDGSEDEFQAYREFVALLGDFNELFDKNGDPIMMQAPNFDTGGPDLNVGAHPQGSFSDHGVTNINYRNEPLWERMKTALTNASLPDEARDPANIFHSGFHGDPSTHIFKSYSNDPIRFRVLATNHEELHNFVLNGLHPTGFNGFVPPFLGLQAQTIGTAEQFTFDFTAPVAVSPRNDYMYSSYITNDIFSGMWGLTRVWCNEESLEEDPMFGPNSAHPVQLAPLPGIEPVDCSYESPQATQQEINDDQSDLQMFAPGENTPQIIPTSASISKSSSTQNQKIVNSIQQQQQSIQRQENEFTTTPTINNLIQKDSDNNIFDGFFNILQKNILPEAKAQETPSRTILIPPQEDPQATSPPDSPSLTQPPPSLTQPPPSLTPSPATSSISPVPATGVGPKSINELGISPTSCDPDAPRVTYKVVALKDDIILNKFEDVIPDGIFFVLEEDADAILNGQKPLEPLVLRANIGECVVLELTNNLNVTSLPIPAHDHPLQPGECNEHVVVACLDPDDWQASNRVSLHPDNLFYDVGAFDGTNMGFNPVDQTVGLGETITYEWQATKTGTNVLTDMGDLRGHRHHGGYGMLIVEPSGAQYLDINTQQPIKSGAAADIVFPDHKKNFREFALNLGTSHYIITQDDPDLCILPPEEEEEEPNPGEPEPLGEPPGCNQEPVNDPEDQGFPAINYRSEPFVHRLIEASQEGPPADLSDAGLEASKRISQLQSSLFHDDPATPILRVPEGKPTVLRVADIGDSARSYSFHVAGHLMLRPAPISLDPADIPADVPFEPFIERGTTDQLSPSRSFSLELVGGAGGLQDKHGDYLYQDQKIARMVEGGAWGILRVQPADFDPIKAAKYLLDDISYSKNIPSDIKPILIEETQKILDNLLSYDHAKIKEICEDIIPNLLRFLSEYEDKDRYNQQQQYYSNTYNDANDTYDDENYDTYDDTYDAYKDVNDAYKDVNDAYKDVNDAYDDAYEDQQQYYDVEYNKENTEYGNDYYSGNDYSYGTNDKDASYGDNYNQYYDDTLTFEKLKEILRDIAYSVC
jgi:hypothetical protein